jgi:hypothetical protein
LRIIHISTIEDNDRTFGQMNLAQQYVVVPESSGKEYQ